MINTIVLLATSILLTLKVMEFIPDNIWLWRFGPRLVQHLRHDTTVSLPSMEANGMSCVDCKVRVPRRPRLSLGFIGIPDNASVTVFSKRYSLNRWTSWLSKFTNLAFWTPLLAVLGGVVLTLTARHAARWVVVLSAADFAAIATFTLVVAPILRLSLGSFDIQYSDLARLATIFKQRLAGMDNDRETLAIYFLGLVMVSIFCYAMMFQGIYVADPSSFHFDWGNPNVFSWLFYSITTASTFGDSQAQVTDIIGEIGIVLQILTGPLLIFWLLSVLIERNLS